MAIPLAMSLFSLCAIAWTTPRGAIDLSLTPTVHRPLLVDIKQEFKGNFTVTMGEKREDRPTESVDEYELIDELTRSDPQHTEATRYFVRANKDTDGEVQDPPLNGLTAVLKRTGEQSSVELADGRFLPQSDVDALLRTAPSVGFVLALPNSALVGNDYAVDLEPLASVLLSNDVQKNTGDANLLFESFDDATGIARLRGTAQLGEEGNVQGLDMTLAYVCDCSIEVNTREKRLTAITISGTYTANGAAPDGRVQFEGYGRYKCTLTTQMGEPVIKARYERIRHRERTFRAASLGVSILLPCSYAKVDEPGSAHVFQRMLKARRVAQVCLDRLDGDARNPQAYYDSVRADLRRQYSEVTLEKVSSPLGAGQAFILTRTVDGEEMRVRSEVYPYEGHFLLFKLQADPDTLSSALPEFAKARKSLKKLKG
ncbi:MAG: hypothetical protein U1E76_23560 [Planctomycetota bacterium]